MFYVSEENLIWKIIHYGVSLFPLEGRGENIEFSEVFSKLKLISYKIVVYLKLDPL